MSKITIKKITDIKEAEKLWKTLSPNEVIFDDWSFRYAYYKYFNFPLFFYAGYDNDELIGLLGLQYTEFKKCLEFFGGGYFDDNRIFLKKGYENQAKLFFDQINLPIKLQYMKYSYDEVPGFKFQEARYFLDLEGFTSSDDYIEKTWHGKSRQNLRAQMRKIKEMDLKIVKDDFSNYERMVELNLKRFGDDSSFRNPHRADFFRDAIDLFDFHTIGIYINGELESVGLGVLYNNVFHGLNSGTNPEINGLGKFLTLNKLDQAIKNGAKIYDANVGELGWKEAFHFSNRPQYIFEK